MHTTFVYWGIVGTGMWRKGRQDIRLLLDYIFFSERSSSERGFVVLLSVFFLGCPEHFREFCNFLLIAFESALICPCISWVSWRINSFIHSFYYICKAFLLGLLLRFSIQLEMSHWQILLVIHPKRAFLGQRERAHILIHSIHHIHPIHIITTTGKGCSSNPPSQPVVVLHPSLASFYPT